MQFLKRLFQFYIFSNIHVALATFCLVKITLLSYNISENNTALFVFFSTIVAYNCIRFLRISDIPDWFTVWLNTHKKLLYILTGISLVIVVFLAIQFQLKALLWLFPFSIFTLFYMIPLPLKKQTLRKIGGVKLFLIAISWAGITVLFPLVQNNISITTDVWLIFVQRFFFVILITIPFDIRDVHIDEEELKTLPQRVGVQKSKVIGLLFGLLFLIVETFKIQSISEGMNIDFIILFISILFLMKSTEKQSKYYSAFWVESLPIVWFLLIVFL